MKKIGKMPRKHFMQKIDQNIGKPTFLQKNRDISKTRFCIEVELEIIFLRDIWPSYNRQK